jgi:hypothetical protein
MDAADPNKAKLYALGLCCAAAFIALFTLRSNFDYFMQYYLGWGLKTRQITFLGVEAFLVLIPLAKGFGNRKQIIVFYVAEAVLLPLVFLHTYLVSELVETRKDAVETKQAARGDYLTQSQTIKDILAANKLAQDSYNTAQQRYNNAMARYERLKRQALRDKTPLPPMPTVPSPAQLTKVPELKQDLVNNAAMSVSQVVENKVNHGTLRTLQFIILLLAVAGTSLMVMFSDTIKVREWFMRHRERDMRHMMKSQAPYALTMEDYGGNVMTQSPQIGFMVPTPPVAPRYAHSQHGQGQPYGQQHGQPYVQPYSQGQPPGDHSGK